MAATGHDRSPSARNHEGTSQYWCQGLTCTTRPGPLTERSQKCAMGDPTAPWKGKRQDLTPISNGERLGGSSRVGSLAAPFAGVLGLLGARGADALQEDGCRLVVRVLGDELATEGFGEVGLIEMIEKLCSH